MKSNLMFYVVIVIVILNYFIPINGVSSQTTNEVVPLDMTPIPSYNEDFEFNLNITQGWSELELDQINTGRDYYHILSFTVSDNITSGFGINEYYKIRLEYDLLSTIIEPETNEIVIEDGESDQFALFFEIENSDIVEIKPSVVSLSESVVELQIYCRIQTFIIPSFSYDLNQLDYEINLLPSLSYFISTGSFTWVYHPTSFLFLDPNLIDVIAGNEISFSIMINMISVVEDNDRIRISAGGSDGSTTTGRPENIELTFSPTKIVELEISTLSEYLEFEIISIEFILSNSNNSGLFNLTSLPQFGWIFALILYGISFLIVYKYSVRVHLEKLEKEGIL